MAPKYRLTYFNGRGMAELIRFLFAYGNVEYEDVRIEAAQWPELKPKQPFGKLPVLEVDGVVLSESGAIARYVAKELGLTGKNDLESARCDMIISALVDLFSFRREYVMEKDEAKKEEILKKFASETIPATLPFFQKQLQANGTKYFVGDSITWADIAMGCGLNELKARIPNILDNFDDLREHTERIVSNSNIKEWIEKRPKTDF